MLGIWGTWEAIDQNSTLVARRVAYTVSLTSATVYLRGACCASPERGQLRAGSCRVWSQRRRRDTGSTAGHIPDFTVDHMATAREDPASGAEEPKSAFERDDLSAPDEAPTSAQPGATAAASPARAVEQGKGNGRAGSAAAASSRDAPADAQTVTTASGARVPTGAAPSSQNAASPDDVVDVAEFVLRERLRARAWDAHGHLAPKRAYVRLGRNTGGVVLVSALGDLLAAADVASPERMARAVAGRALRPSGHSSAHATTAGARVLPPRPPPAVLRRAGVHGASLVRRPEALARPGTWRGALRFGARCVDDTGPLWPGEGSSGAGGAKAGACGSRPPANSADPALDAVVPFVAFARLVRGHHASAGPAHAAMRGLVSSRAALLAELAPRKGGAAPAVTAAQLGDAMRAVGAPAPPAAARALVQAFDRDGNGSLDAGELHAALRRPLRISFVAPAGFVSLRADPDATVSEVLHSLRRVRAGRSPAVCLLQRHTVAVACAHSHTVHAMRSPIPPDPSQRMTSQSRRPGAQERPVLADDPIQLCAHFGLRQLDAAATDAMAQWVRTPSAAPLVCVSVSGSRGVGTLASATAADSRARAGL